MASAWHFFERRPNDKVRDPIQGEFFASDGEGDSFEALVREAIQNSLDATSESVSAPIRVRIRVGEIPASRVAPFLKDSWDHVRATRNGLRNAPRQSDACRFVAIEDFETTGLEGDECATSQSEAKKNGFFCFFRAEGVSEKEGDDRGRWGLGKTVFPKSSRMNAMFGLTVRHSDRKRLLMGNIALKTRSVNGREWTPDGWFGVLDAAGTVLPTADASEIDAFVGAFSLTRGGHCGLSVVIPFLDSDQSLEEVARSLEREIARAYFIPILRRQLDVEIVSGRSVAIDTDRIRALCQEQEFPAEEAAIVSLALAAVPKPSAEPVTHAFEVAACQSDRQEWSAFSIDEANASDLRSRLEGGQIVEFTVPVRVLQKDPPRLRIASLTMLLRRDELVTKSISRFIREGITITRERKAPAQAGMVALVEIGPGALASALGDAENPAHTQWNPKSNNGRMKEKYTHAPALLEYVRQAPHAITQAIYCHDAPDDDVLLAEFFPQDLLDDGRQAPKPGSKKKPKRVGPPALPPPPRPRLVRIESGNKGEFAVLPGGATMQHGVAPRVKIRVAYDRQSGNPLAKWNPADFTLSIASIRQRVGVKLLRCEGNQLEFEIESSDFELRVGGFDDRRDLIVSSTVSEVTNDSQD